MAVPQLALPLPTLALDSAVGQRRVAASLALAEEALRRVAAQRGVAQREERALPSARQGRVASPPRRTRHIRIPRGTRILS